MNLPKLIDKTQRGKKATELEKKYLFTDLYKMYRIDKNYLHRFKDEQVMAKYIKDTPIVDNTK